MDRTDTLRWVRNQETEKMSIKPISETQLEELTGLLEKECQVIPRDDLAFQRHARLFNGSIQTPSCLLVRVLTAKDVSEVVKFAQRHDLSVSVKAGGYGTAGYAIQGDIIIDLCAMDSIDIEPPRDAKEGELEYTPLRKMPYVVKDMKGKGKISGFKRRGGGGDDDDDTAANLGKPRPSEPNYLSNSNINLPPPLVRRKLGPSPGTDGSPQSDIPQSGSGSGSGDSGSRSGSSLASTLRSDGSTEGTTPEHTKSLSMRSESADPFGYIDDPVPITSTPGPTTPSCGVGSVGVGAPSSSSSTNQAQVPPLAQYLHITQPPSFTYFRPSAHSSFAQLFQSQNQSQLPSMSVSGEPTPAHDHAYITFGAGARQKEIDLYSHANPLPALNPTGRGVPYHVPFTAHPVGSSVMLLGGFGFVSRLHGLSCDNLVEVEMVLADGEIVIINKKQHPDLWWAVRGAGPAFGIATRYKALAYPIPSVYAGTLIYKFRASTAPSFIKHVRDCVKQAPPNLYIIILMTAGPPSEDAIIALQVCWTGKKEEEAKGREYVNAIRAWESSGEGCLLNDVCVRTFVSQQESVECMLRGVWGRKWFVRSDLLTALPDDVIHNTVLKFSQLPLGCTWLFELAGGKITNLSPDTAPNCIPQSRREALWNVAAFHQWDIENDEAACVLAAQEWIEKDLKPMSAGGCLPSFLARSESPARIRGAYGENWDRLKKLKEVYDPKRVWKWCFWEGVEGEEGEEEEEEEEVSDKAWGKMVAS